MEIFDEKIPRFELTEFFEIFNEEIPRLHLPKLLEMPVLSDVGFEIFYHGRCAEAELSFEANSYSVEPHVRIHSYGDQLLQEFKMLEWADGLLSEAPCLASTLPGGYHII